MDVLVLIDKLDDTVHNAKPVPLTDQVRVDKEEIYDILDQMRATIPEEIKQARWIVKERQEMLAEAKREAERIIKRGARGAGAPDRRRRGRQAGRAPGRRDRRGRPRPRARDPPGRRGLRRRHPQHPRDQPREVHRRGAARARPAPGPRRAEADVRLAAALPQIGDVGVAPEGSPVLASRHESSRRCACRRCASYAAAPAGGVRPGQERANRFRQRAHGRRCHRSDLPARPLQRLAGARRADHSRSEVSTATPAGPPTGRRSSSPTEPPARLTTEDYDIFVRDFVNEHAHGRSTNTQVDSLSSDHPAWSPDGTRIAYEHQPDSTGSTERDIKIKTVGTAAPARDT